MQIQVINDNKVVFEGDAEQWLTDNQGDEITAEMIAETAEKGYCEGNFTGLCTMAQNTALLIRAAGTF